MKNLIFILFLSATITFLSCSNSTDSMSGVAQLRPDIGLSFVDENGKDLLNSEHKNAWTEDNIDIYYLEDGKKVRAHNPNQDMPNNFKINYAEDQDKYVMKLWLSNHMDNENYTTTFIELPDGKTDTVKIKARREGGSLWAQKLWYNGEFLWEIADDGPSDPRYFVRTK